MMCVGNRMKKLKVIIKIIVFCSIYIGAQAALKYILLDDTMTISRMMLHELYTQEENVDVLFCGASHCQLGFDTAVTDREMGLFTFNAGSSSQGLETSLALIKEASAYYDLKQVYVDLDYSIVMREEPNLESIYIISDYMRPSFRKVSYLLNATSFEYYLNSFMPLHKGRGYRTNPSVISETVRKKALPGYRNYTDADPSYAGKGHIASETVVEDGTMWGYRADAVISTDIPETQKKYLRQIIAFCRKKGIQLTFVSVPVTDFHLVQVENYDAYADALRAFLAEYGAAYYDFNMCRQEVLALDRDSWFNDDNHLNRDGSMAFSAAFSRVFGEADDRDAFFYDSYAEKLASEEPRVLGISVKKGNDGMEPEFGIVANRVEFPATYTAEHCDGGVEVTVMLDGAVTNRIRIAESELK